jgi:hypothetical protein
MFIHTEIHPGHIFIMLKSKSQTESLKITNLVKCLYPRPLQAIKMFIIIPILIYGIIPLHPNLGPGYKIYLKTYIKIRKMILTPLLYSAY